MTLAPSPYPTLDAPKPMDGSSACQVRATRYAPTCGLASAWHVAWTPAPGPVQTSFLCPHHMTHADAEHVYADRHPVTATCALPGMHWHGPRGHCALPDDDHDHAAQETARAH